MAFVHVSIRTRDMEKAIRFYSQFFGMRLAARREIPQNNAEIAFLESEGIQFRLELTWFKKQERFEQPAYEDRLFDHLAFTITDMDKTIGDMRRAGITITDEPFSLGPGGSRLAFVEDPDGTLIELIENKQ